MPTTLSWVILTRGDRPVELRVAIDSLIDSGPADVLIWQNGGPVVESPSGIRWVRSEENLGVPGGRGAAVHQTNGAVVAFLDDDAEMLTSGVHQRIVEAFDDDPSLGAITFRIIDEKGGTSRRHVPRVGGGSAASGGDVATFLGGACAVRRSAYDAAGGYWSELFYAHEELDLAWRLRDAGYRVAYDAKVLVRHPRTSISRHPDGWRLTGRNRVMVARRNLPWPVAVVHVINWLVIGAIRAPDQRCRAAYVGGWWAGWRRHVERRSISWRTVYQLARVGRPPIV